MIKYQQKNTSIVAFDKSYLLMYFLIIADHLLEYAIKKTVISNNWQNQQLYMIINNYFTNVQSNLVEPQLKNSIKKSQIYLFN
jgi:hypothetical protein